MSFETSMLIASVILGMLFWFKLYHDAMWINQDRRPKCYHTGATKYPVSYAENHCIECKHFVSCLKFDRTNES